MKMIAFLVLFLSMNSFAGLIGGTISPLGSGGANMARTGQTLNQVDQQNDGHLTRDQNAQEREEESSFSGSYNDEAHRNYVKRQKAKKKGAPKAP